MTQSDSKLMDMLTGYAAAHQHPVNVAVHMVGIPTIMLGVLIPLTWVSVEIVDFRFDLAQLTVVAFFVYYLTLDRLFALVFLIAATLLWVVANAIGAMPFSVSATIAAVCFFGGYLAQFVGHAIEKSLPVVLKHPVQANLAAPFFTVVELFKFMGLRDDLFNEVQRRIADAGDADSQTAGV